MSSNVGKRRVVVVHPRVDETSTGETAASETVHSDRAKNGSETTQARSLRPVEYGWDFPFDFPKPAR
jgi:hypothetical protein